MVRRVRPVLRAVRDKGAAEVVFRPRDILTIATGLTGPARTDKTAAGPRAIPFADQ